ncbi:MAG: hypothetical protein H0Z28_10205 [Archaeoglobus sp.]|nr:hypothetical protein [Archaeoglobus sp.]
MVWDIDIDGYRWGRREVKEKLLEGKRVYKVEILNPDGTPANMTEEMELPLFLEFCPYCGQNIVDTRKGGGCPLRNDCCEVCWRKCQKLGSCRLK